MRACLDRAQVKLQDQWIQLPNEEHRQFHMRVFHRLNNPFVIGILEAYWDAYNAVELNRYADDDYLQRVWEYHGRILTGICAGDFDAALQDYIEHTQLLRYQPRMRDMNQT
jgi:DNA-binding FadR family transcriptional regulator